LSLNSLNLSVFFPWATLIFYIAFFPVVLQVMTKALQTNLLRKRLQLFLASYGVFIDRVIDDTGFLIG